MKLYHGSKQTIENPIVNGSRIDNDYGPAFYLTRDLVSAHEWACRNGTIGVVNKYSFRMDGLKILDLTDKSKYSVLNWLAVLLHFRTLESGFIKAFKTRLDYIEENFYIDINQYDVIIGFRADDAYFRFPLDFIRGNLTLSQLDYAYGLGKLGVQYVLLSEKAFNRLKFVEAIPSEQKYIDSYFDNVRKASEQFDALDKDIEGIRIFDLVRGNK